MTLKEFQSLTEMDQIKILIRHGILIGETKTDDCRTFAYQVQNFYVATKYTIDTDDLLSIQSFETFDMEKESFFTDRIFQSIYPKNLSQ
jgi:hypothetical protein